MCERAASPLQRQPLLKFSRAEGSKPMPPRECLKRRLDHDGLFAEWIDIAEPNCPQRKLPLHLTRFAVEDVADHRMGARGQMNPDLMGAARDRSGKKQ